MLKNTVLALAVLALAGMKWSTLIEGSRMTFDNGGGPLPVAAFDPLVHFDPTNLAGSRITLRADLSAAFIPPDRIAPVVKEGLAMARNTGAVPEKSSGKMVFTSDRIRRESTNAFVMSGTLEINGRRREKDIPFTARMMDDPQGSMKLVLAGGFGFSPAHFQGGNLPEPGAETITVAFELHEIPAQQ